MGNPLTKESLMECPRHGLQRPAFVCTHLQGSENIGFFESNSVDPELPFREAWCGKCDEVLLEQGEWNDVSESHAQIVVICEGCFFEVQKRNS